MLRAFHHYPFSILLVDVLGGLTEMYFLIVFEGEVQDQNVSNVECS
jgi:hypothetical protein